MNLFIYKPLLVQEKAAIALAAKRVDGVWRLLAFAVPAAVVAL